MMKHSELIIETGIKDSLMSKSGIAWKIQQKMCSLECYLAADINQIKVNWK